MALSPKSLVQCGEVRGSRSTAQEISHSSVLAIGSLVYMSPLVELHFENVQLQDKRDWALVIESMNPSHLETFSLCKSSANQLLSTAGAVDVFFSRFERDEQEQQDAKLVLATLTIDESLLVENSLVRILCILHRSRVNHVWVNCNSLSHNMSAAFIQVVGTLQWSSVKSLVLSGSNLNVWVPLLTGVTTPQMQRLHIHGTGTIPEVLEYPSSSLILHLISTSDLIGLKFENVQMQYKIDWVLIMESMNHLVVCTFDMDTICNRQFMSVRDAAEFYRAKLKSMKEY
ncbi:hypothetical protein BGZ81_007126 [Podila clonocystis]|nr:hypothetical protein BGZ81_007126 [Podila clonocystis]